MRPWSIKFQMSAFQKAWNRSTSMQLKVINVLQFLQIILFSFSLLFFFIKRCVFTSFTKIHIKYFILHAFRFDMTFWFLGSRTHISTNFKAPLDDFHNFSSSVHQWLATQRNFIKNVWGPNHPNQDWQLFQVGNVVASDQPSWAF